MADQKSGTDGGPIELQGALAYQEDAVVSRVLSRTPSGSITLFAFDKGTGLDEHSTPSTALVQVLEGVAGVSIEGTSYSVTEGSLIHLPAGVPHALRATERFKMLLTMFKPTTAKA